jgi:DnaJ-domain-containing protein 1
MDRMFGVIFVRARTEPNETCQYGRTRGRQSGHATVFAADLFLLPVTSPLLRPSSRNPPTESSLTRGKAMSDHYQTLGLRRDATKAEVKTAFRGRALRDHPDRHAGSSDAAARDAAARRFRQASDAYQILSDDRRRADYDLRLRSSSSSYARTSSSGWASSSSSASYGYGYGYGHEGGSWRRPPSGRGGSPAGSVDWEFVLKAVTRPGFLINVGFAW